MERGSWKRKRKKKKRFRRELNDWDIKLPKTRVRLVRLNKIPFKRAMFTRVSHINLLKSPYYPTNIEKGRCKFLDIPINEIDMSWHLFISWLENQMYRYPDGTYLLHGRCRPFKGIRKSYVHWSNLYQVPILRFDWWDKRINLDESHKRTHRKKYGKTRHPSRVYQAYKFFSKD